MRSKPIIILLVTFIIISLIGFFVIRPVVSSIWSSWRSLEQARTDLKSVEEKKKILEALKDNPDLSSVGEIALKYIPQESASGELVVEIAAIASANNLTIEEITMERQKESTAQTEEQTTKENKATPTPQVSAEKKSEFNEVEFALKVSGTYNDLVNFLRGIESSSRLIAINKFALQMSQNAENKGALSSQMSGAAFYKTDISLEKNLQNIQVLTETIEKFLNLKTFGSPINLPTESGFGRTNPFENY